MRGLAPALRVLPEGRHLLTLKARAVLVNGDLRDLLWDMYVYCYALQKTIDALWELDKIPSLSQVHQLFYRALREKYGFRAHVTMQLYKYALALVKSAKSNGGSKPKIRKLSVRLDKYDAKVNLERMEVEIVIRNKRYRLKLLHNLNYIKKFIGRKWYEVIVKWENNSLWVCIPFEFEYKPYKPERIMAVDINLKQIVLFDGKRIRRINTRFIEALSLKAHAENIQRKYPKRWRYNPRILNRIRELHRRSKNIITDNCRKIAKSIVLKAKRLRACIVLEDLEKLWFVRSQENSKLAWKLSRFAYRKLQNAIITKAIEYSVPVIFVDPKNTSNMCPRCCSKLEYVYRLGYCRNCGLIADRDTIGAMNLYFRVLNGNVPGRGSRVNARPMKNETRQRAGNKMRG